jgi:type II secretory pathway pseudopilin PulG
MTYLRISRRGTSLIELLVVIVIFLIGILAVIQIFPKGLQIIDATRNTSMMNALARAELDRLRGRVDQLPEQIIPVIYSVSGSVVSVSADANRNVDDISPYSNRLDQNGNLLDTIGNSLGNWQYLSGANNVRRVIGEGGAVPAPRPVGTQFGGLMVLQFAPIVFNPSFQGLFTVYGNDLVRRDGTPPNFGRVRDWEYYVEDADDAAATIYLYNPTPNPIEFRIAMSAWITNGPNNYRREVVDGPSIVVPAGASYQGFPLANFAGTMAMGESFNGAEFDSIKVQRLFQRVPNATAFTGDPYEYKLMDETLGLVLFNRTGFNYTIPRQNGRRVPLTARVNYDVYDWRILREEFRVAATYPAEQKMALQNLMHLNKTMADGRRFAGLNVTVSDGAGGTENRDFLMLDLQSGGIVARQSLQVDYSRGIVTMIDSDSNPTNGVQIGVVYPGNNAATTVNAVGRPMRVLYMASGEWSVQVTKAASSYRGEFNRPGYGQYYAGGSRQAFFGAPLVPGESTTRIYFPPMDAGKKVTVGQIWYDTATSTEPLLLQNQDFLITNSPADQTVGLPYIDLRTYDPDAVSINYARYGVGVRGVKGASVRVRVLWNPTTFALTNVEATNIERLEQWGRNYRRISAESYLQKEEN